MANEVHISPLDIKQMLSPYIQKSYYIWCVAKKLILQKAKFDKANFIKSDFSVRELP
jgi:hypothetical protein